MKLWALIFLFLSAAGGSGQTSLGVGGGLVTNGSAGLGYVSPSFGVWGRMQWKNLRLTGEWDASHKWWVDNGSSWRTTTSIDSPQWHALSALAIAGVSQHRNNLWVKTGVYYGAGLRYGPFYSYYLPPDTSPNHTSRWVGGLEVVGNRKGWSPYFNSQAMSVWFDQSGLRMYGWEVNSRIGVNWNR
jgi:hypothetical protein